MIEMNTLLKPKSIAIAASILLVGCSSAPPLELQTSPLIGVAFPDVGATATVEIGQTIISKANLQRRPAIKLPFNVSEKISLGTTNVKAGVLPLWAKNQEGSFYRDYSSTFTFTDTIPHGQGGIFVPSNNALKPVVYYVPHPDKIGKIPVSGIEHTISETWSKDSYKRELVYTGISQNTISVLYREFSDDVARPAFSQDLKYDLSQGKTIGYKGARFEVVNATNTELTFKVIKQLD